MSFRRVYSLILAMVSAALFASAWPPANSAYQQLVLIINGITGDEIGQLVFANEYRAVVRGVTGYRNGDHVTGLRERIANAEYFNRHLGKGKQRWFEWGQQDFWRAGRVFPFGLVDPQRAAGKLHKAIGMIE